MKNVLVLVFSNLRHDARVSRQVDWLKKRFQVTVVCFGAEGDNMEVIRIQQTELTPVRKGLLGVALLLRQYAIAFSLFHDYSETINALKKRNWDLIVANDIDTLPIAFQVKGNAKIIFDAHEYAPRHFEDKPVWRMFFQPFYLHLCRKFIPRIDGMLTVGRGLADEYKKEFGINPLIITNAARYHNVAPSPMEANRIRLIHHGIANASRRLEIMIDMMELLDERFTLDLILMTSEYASGQTRSYIETLKERALKNPRIKILPAVRSSEIVATINKYDMGVFIIPPINFNYANTLPNKLFDFLQARLGIAIGPTPEMAEITATYDVGVVSEEFTAESLAAKLNSLSVEKVWRYKNNAVRAAAELNAEKNEERLNSLIDQISRVN
jgi:hypothetical protein